MDLDDLLGCSEDVAWLSNMPSTYALDMASLTAHAAISDSPQVTLVLDVMVPCYPAGKYDMREALRVFFDEIVELGVIVRYDPLVNIEAKMQTQSQNHHMDIRFDCEDYITAYDVIDCIQRFEDSWFQVVVQEVWHSLAPDSYSVIYSQEDDWPLHTMGTPPDILARLCNNFMQKHAETAVSSEDIFMETE